MILVREVFIAKPGMASKLARMFKEMIDQEGMGRGKNAKVMTDMTGTFNKVVVEMEYEDLTNFDRDMKEYMSQPPKESDPSKPKHTDMYNEGKREIFRIW
ncbi:MAG: hypothetical protein ACE15D_17250 [Candidatus Eisenbacteria bacterium]